MRYITRQDGKGFTVRSGEVTRWACCDCGLIHDIAFEVAEGTIGVAARRNARATAARRRAVLKPSQISGSSTHTWGGEDAVTVTEIDWDGPHPLLLIRTGGSEIALDAKQWGFVAPNAERLFNALASVPPAAESHP